MSNVLIGIIGVILFIGLALAGALFLGPRFQEAGNSSKGSAVANAVSQVAQATEMMRVQEGSTFSGGQVMTRLVPGYLKSVPPTGLMGNGNWYALADDGDPSKSPQWIVLSVVDDGSGRSRNACAVVARNAGMANADGSAPTREKPSGTFGCYQYEGSWGYSDGLIGNWHFFHRI